MSIRKRNEFLDGDESEEEVGNDYESEQEEGRGTIGGHSNKRRKIDPDSDSGSEISDEHDDRDRLTKESDDRFNAEELGSRGGLAEGDFADEDENEDEDDRSRSDHDRIKKRTAAEKQYEKAQKAVRKSGVVYISRVPPFMKPQTLRHFLEPHARKGIGRIFLTPEDHAAHTKRVKSGGNKKKSFTDGWVEFTSKKEAKLAAETLNGNIIGGKKGNFYHDDLWSMKYLKGFKWNHLTEQIANENAERAARVREEIRRTRKENKAFVEDVERAKMLEGMESKKKAKRERDGRVGKEDVQDAKLKRDFQQRKPRSNRADAAEKPSVQASKALSKVF